MAFPSTFSRIQQLESLPGQQLTISVINGAAAWEDWTKHPEGKNFALSVEYRPHGVYSAPDVGWLTLANANAGTASYDPLIGWVRDPHYFDRWNYVSLVSSLPLNVVFDVRVQAKCPQDTVHLPSGLADVENLVTFELVPAVPRRQATLQQHRVAECATTAGNSGIPAPVCSWTFLDNNATAGALAMDSSPPRLGLQFQSSVAGCLKGVRFLLVNASATVFIEAFDSRLTVVPRHLTCPALQTLRLPFGGPGLDIPALTVQYVSARTSLSYRRYAPNVYTAGPRTNGALSYLNSWYQYPSYTNPAVAHNFLGTDYFVEPVFLHGDLRITPLHHRHRTQCAALAHGRLYLHQTNLNANTDFVQISLSTDCGATYPVTIAASTPATGTFTFTPTCLLAVHAASRWRGSAILLMYST
jgi:hypothetical protein